MIGNSEKRSAAERLDWTRAVSAGIAAMTFVFGVVTYLQQSKTQAAAQLEQRQVEEANRKAEQVRALDLRDRELSQRFREEQFSLYQKAMDSASTLATRGGAAATDPLVRQALQDFWSLYWGKLAMVESPEVAQAMVAFGRGLERCTATKPERECQTCLKFLALGLAHRCRESVSSQWGTKLTSLDDPPQFEQCRKWVTTPPP